MDEVMLSISWWNSTRLSYEEALNICQYDVLKTPLNILMLLCV